MYELKPILEKIEVIIPKCMYKVRPLNESQCNGLKNIENEVDVSEDYIIENFGEQIQLCLKKSLEMTDLEIRQRNLLKQLENLKSQLLEIRSEICVPKTVGNYILASNVKTDDESFNDIVVNASPDCIPYGLLALKNAWNGIFNINITVYAHSTITTLNKEAIKFQNEIKNLNTNQNCPHIDIVLIWKNSEHTEMVTSSASYVPIYGEVNILRYLSRLGPVEYRYENDLRCNENDAILDISYQLPCCCGGKSRSQLIKFLNGYLQKHKYFGGENWSVADIGVFSALKRSVWLSQKDLTENLRKWFERIKLITLF